MQTTDLPWEMLYADNLVLVADTKQGVLDKHRERKEVMKARGLRMNFGITKTMISCADDRGYTGRC